MSGQTSQIRERMGDVGIDGRHVGTMDNVEGGRIKLTNPDDPDGSGQHHHYIPCGIVAAVQDNQMRLSQTASQTRQAAQATDGAGDEPVTGP